ncbi:hypothetical protein, partial [Stenotrophomonas maltophilia]|uniref:hypothetical protein n=2 Tax=Lysobacteraceae TaxID=32033 RepID=UPI001C60AC83
MILPIIFTLGCLELQCHERCRPLSIWSPRSALSGTPEDQMPTLIADFDGVTVDERAGQDLLR